MGLAYNIFRKTTETLLVWVQAAVNLDEAKKRLISLASTEPDDYLIWDPADHRFIEPLRKSAYPLRMLSHSATAPRVSVLRNCDEAAVFLYRNSA